MARVTASLWWLVWLVLRAYALGRPRHTFRLDGRRYLTRYYLTGTGPTEENDHSTGQPGWYLHHIHEPDTDRRLHNHPWRWARYWILRGGYVEFRQWCSGEPDDPPWSVRVREIRAGDRMGLSEHIFHRIARVCPNTWTLFHSGPKHGRGWGFMK